MLCQEFRQNLSLYVDDRLASAVRAICDEHLRGCPLCREDLAEMRFLTINLQKVEAPPIPLDLTASIQRAVAIEIAAQTEINQPRSELSRWQCFWQKRLQPQLLPYSIGATASVLLFMLMFVSLRNSIESFRIIELDARRARQERETLLAAAPNKLPYDELPTLPAADYAVRRLPIAAISPSLNPSSAFVSLTASLATDDAEDQAIMVVADVLGDGIANIADVIKAPREPAKLIELEKLLHEDPAFVPATLDRRPNNVRVVLLIQQVEVKEPGSNAAPKAAKTHRF